jgi:hypothetical protein
MTIIFGFLVFSLIAVLLDFGAFAYIIGIIVYLLITCTNIRITTSDASPVVAPTTVKYVYQKEECHDATRTK